MNIDNLCMNCMQELHGEKQCPNCGYYIDSPQISPYLPLRTTVGGKYIIGKMLSSNSEGASYIAFDFERKTPVMIREYLPDKFIERGFGETEVTIRAQWNDIYYIYLKKFLDMWRRLARVRGLSALIPVIDIIEENNTAYAVTEYIESISLREFLLKSSTGYLNWEKAKVLFMPVLSTLSTLHSMGIIHYGLNPDNMLIGRDGKLRISGFSISEARIEGFELSPELFEGYTPIEQYSYGYEEGAWSDVYSFCAVLYRALVGTVPQDAVSRSVNDRLIIPARYAEIIPVYVINALMNGLQVDPVERTGDIESLREELSATPGNVVSSFSGVNAPPAEERPKAQAAPAEEQQSSSSTGKIILITFLICLGIGLLAFAGYMAYDKFVKPAGEPSQSNQEEVATFEVGNFVNESYTLIASNTVQNERFKISSTMEYSSTVPEGYIISQSIEPGTIVPMGTEITFVVSKGPEYVVIPSGIVGEMSVFVEQQLKDAGLTVKVVEKSNDGSQEEGVVYGVSPGEGTKVIKGSEVYVQVWGAPPETEPETEESTTKNPFDFIFGG